MTPTETTVARREGEFQTIRKEISADNLPSTPMQMLAEMSRCNATPEALSKMMDLQERWEKSRAAEAFATALAEFQSKCQPIRKRRDAKPSGSFAGYRYCSLDDIMASIKPILGDCGLSVGFDAIHDPNDKGGSVTVTVAIRKGIHEQRSTFRCPIPDMRVNDTQKYGAALSYAKRYALCAALNIVVTDEDNDAKNLTEKPITEEQAIQLEDMAESYGCTPEYRTNILGIFNVEHLRDVLASDFTPVFNMIEKKNPSRKLGAK